MSGGLKLSQLITVLKTEPERLFMKAPFLKSFTVFASVLVSIVVSSVSLSARADMPSTHGMLLFGGSNAVYASHLPMFHSPHDYQVILELALDSQSSVVKTFKKLNESGETLFTIEPETMDLTQVIDGSKKQFSAALYQGHFEQGGKNLGQVQVAVKKIIFSAKLIHDASPLDHEEYLIFGGAGEYYAAHLIKSKPSFDQIMKVNQPYQLQFPHCRTRVCSEPAKNVIDDAKLPVVSLDSPAPMTQPKLPKTGDVLGGFSVAITEILNVVYSEEAELSH